MVNGSRDRACNRRPFTANRRVRTSVQGTRNLLIYEIARPSIQKMATRRSDTSTLVMLLLASQDGKTLRVVVEEQNNSEGMLEALIVNGVDLTDYVRPSPYPSRPCSSACAFYLTPPWPFSFRRLP